MMEAIQTFVDGLDYFIDMSLQNPLFQLIYGYLAVAFVVAIIIQIIMMGKR